TVDDDAGIVPSRGARKHGIGHQTRRGLDIGWIDGSSPDLDQHLVDPARQRVPLDRRHERLRILRLGIEPHAAGLDGKTIRFGDRLHQHLRQLARPRRSTRRKLPQCHEIALYESLFLGAAPLLEPAFILDRVGDPLEPLRENECYGSTRCRVTAERARIMLGYSDFEGGSGYPDVEAPVGTSENITKGTFAICHLRTLRSPPSS